MSSLNPLFNPPADAPTVNFAGASRRQYSLQLHRIGAAYFAYPGVYVFCNVVGNTAYPLYVGETDNFLRRLSDELAAHHRWQCVVARGVTHIATLRVVEGDAYRFAVETDLRNGLNPPCNRE